MFKKILVAVDGSSHADSAFDAAVDIAQKYEAELIVLHIFQGSTGTGTIVSGVEEDTRKDIGQEIIKSYEIRLKNKNFSKAKLLLEKGDAAHRIMETASLEKVGLIVLGSRGRGGFKELLLGSVSHKVANHAECTVMIVR